MANALAPAAALLAVACATFLAPAAAHAWMQEHGSTAGTCGARWQVTKVPYTRQVVGSTEIPPEDLERALQSSLAAWQDVRCGLCADPGNWRCSTHCEEHPLGIAFTDAGVGTVPARMDCSSVSIEACADLPPVGISVRWIGDGEPWDVGANVVGYTVLQWRRDIGAIGAADVQVRATSADACDGGCASQQFDVANTLTHELGHALGLLHSADLPATMAPNTKPGETSKRTLDLDDRLGICAVYAVKCSDEACPTPTEADDPLANEPTAPPDKGCDTRRVAPATPAYMVGFWAFLLLRHHRRRPLGPAG